MYCDLWPYVWLVFKSGFKSRAGYSGALTVFILKIRRFVDSVIAKTCDEPDLGLRCNFLVVEFQILPQDQILQGVHPQGPSRCNRAK